ncbi:MAG: tripartite tricarboxylate transporter substrate-binding protein [Xanthobacteraceae bacterium]|jgi:tripartite-type tricarboxylate transporter receptor subunit TctC
MRRTCAQYILATGLAMLAGTSLATAQEYPSRPITMVVPFPAGGPLDSVARIMAERMRVALGQAVVIDNVGGASGTVGIGRVIRATPDGYTIVAGGLPTNVLNGAVMALPYDPLDIQPISLTIRAPLLVVARKSMPANDLKELITWLKANPDKASQGTGGIGATSHIAGVFFQQLSGTRFTLVPYRGAGPAMQDLLSEQIDMMIDPASGTLPQVRAGKIKAYAVTDDHRLAAAPDIPTAAEAGLPGFEIVNWQGFFAPKGTPSAVVERLNAAIVETMADPAVRSRLMDLGQEIFPREQQTPAALGAINKADIEKWWPIIKAAGVRSEASKP